MKLTVQTFLSLDGVMQAPGGPEEDPSDSFEHGGWQAPFADPAVGEFVVELNGHANAFLFGRRTFEIFRGHWPDETDPVNPIATATCDRRGARRVGDVELRSFRRAAGSLSL